ncbi:hypothetical protein REPUB_Repub08aG0211100 [Reevesia pubescens]
MEPDDPFGWITEACHLSSSEESRLRRSSYFGQSDSDDSDSDSDSGLRNPRDIPVASIGIIMVSPPDSPLDELPNDQTTLLGDQEIFHTPPEYRSTSTSFDDCNDDRMLGDGLDLDGETVAVYVDSVDSRRAVDLGRDTDLGFSEVEVDSTQRIGANSNQDGTFRTESEEVRVSKRGFSPKEQLSTESPSKRLKSLGFKSPSVSLGTSEDRNSLELLLSLKNICSSPGASPELGLEDQQNHEFNFEVGEGSVRKRRPGFSTEVIDSESEEKNMESEHNNGEESSRGKSLDCSTKDVECDTEERNIESGNDNDEGNSGSNKNTVEDSDQFKKRRLDLSTEVIDSESGERNMESENNNGEGSTRGKCLDFMIKDIECDTEERNIESENHNGKGSPGRNMNIVKAIDQVRFAGENGSNSLRMEEKTERKRALPSWANGTVRDDESADEELLVNETELPSPANGRVGDDERADEELEVNEMELPNGRVGDDERADEELQVNERELPSWVNGRVEDDERADEELDVNEREKVHSGKDSDGLSEDFEEITLLDVLMKLKDDSEEDRSLEYLSLLEVAERKWGAFSSDE